MVHLTLHISDHQKKVSVIAILFIGADFVHGNACEQEIIICAIRLDYEKPLFCLVHPVWL